MSFVKKDLSLIRNNIISNIVYNVDKVNDTNIGSTLDMFVTSIAYEIEQQYDQMQLIYEGFHVDTATDYDLDQLGKLIGVKRSGGNESTGTVSFIRNTSPSSSFTIPSGVLVTTQPDANSEVLVYTTTEEGIFLTSATGSEIFIDGIYNYKVDNRVFTSLTIEVAGSPFTSFTTNSNYSGHIIDTATVESIATCESVTGWSNLSGAASLTVNSTYKIQGTNSLNLIKTSTATDNFGYLYSFSNKDLDGLVLCMSVRTTSTFLTNKFSKVEISLGSGYDGGSGTDNNKYTWSLNNTSLFTDGEFSRLFLDLSQASVSNAPNIIEADFLTITLYTQNVTDTVSANEFVMDFWFGCEYENYNGYSIDINTTTKPSSGATMDFAYTPLSVEIPTEAQNIGSDYNVSVGQITYLSSVVSNIDRVYNYDSFVNGEDEELDVDYRERITSGAYAQATSSASAIEENLKTLAYVKNALVIDLPETTVEGETQIYNATTELTPLAKYMAKDTATLLVSDTFGGTADYVKDTDYSLNSDNQLDWGLGGTTPTDGNTIYIDYDYNALGHFNVIVVGSLGYLTTAQIAEVNALVEELKSPGTIATVSQATYSQINVTANISVDSEYDSSTVNNSVVSAVEAYITALGIGEDVLLSQIIKAITKVSGVIDTDTVEINSVASNYTVDTTEKAVPNIVTITEV